MANVHVLSLSLFLFVRRRQKRIDQKLCNESTTFDSDDLLRLIQIVQNIEIQISEIYRCCMTLKENKITTSRMISYEIELCLFRFLSSFLFLFFLFSLYEHIKIKLIKNYVINQPSTPKIYYASRAHVHTQ